VVLLADEEGRACFLLTRRAAGLRAHARQWALPGGRVEAGESAERAALRELSEEVGLVRGASSVLGILDDYGTRSGFIITPVVVWAEGAIFVMGFETGLREWRRLLAPGGHLAVTEVAWTKPDPPPDCSAFWTQEYPAIRPVQELLQVVAECEYETVGHFPLPPSSWWDDYYRPLQHNVTHFRERHGEERDAQELADRVQREIDIWRAYSEFYSYEFFVMRVP